MKHRYKPLKFKKERVMLSDVLPYEIPITFSNRHIYDFLLSEKIELNATELTWKNDDPVINNIIGLLFGVNIDTIKSNSVTLETNKHFKNIPFNYKVSHKETDFRELTVVHVKNQLQIIEFYNIYKDLILYYSNVSPFSIRKAYKIAKYTYFKDSIHKNINNTDNDSIEEYGKEYESLKTFFIYKNYSNIHKFYESYKYHRCEKKYNKLFKFDVSKCFDSIYSHSISWALLDKGNVKGNLQESLKTFGGRFDQIISDLNYGETHGIVIGPEFSRIFAEIILQKIDKNVYLALKSKNVIHKVDYEVFRYVDDFFIFYNDESTKELITTSYKLQLKEFKLYFNDSKSKLYEKPIITELTIAKHRISDLLNKNLKYEFNNTQLDEHEETIQAAIYISSNTLITKFKIIIKETQISYKDILNYTLSSIDKKVAKILRDFERLGTKSDSVKIFTKALLETLDFIFFLYAVSPKVNTTIKLCKILSRIISYIKSLKGFNIDFRHLIFKSIYDNIHLVLQKNKAIEHTQVETLYLLVALSELGKEYWISEDLLCSYFNIKKAESGSLCLEGQLNYFSITVLLFYIKNKVRYFKLKTCILEYVKGLFKERNTIVHKDAELTMLFFDLLTCPFIDENLKRSILASRGIQDESLQKKIIAIREYWFTKWTNFSFGQELDAKQSLEVY